MNSTTITTAEQVLAAVRELRAQDQHATREAIQQVCGLRQAIVDDRLRFLADEGKLQRLARGVYEIATAFPPPRALSVSELDDGSVKVELGDDVMALTPAEARKLARGLGGFLADLHAIEASRQTLALIGRLTAEVDELSRVLTARATAFAEKGSDGP